MTDASDHQLLKAIAAGDGGALAALYDRHAARLLGLLVGWLCDRGEAEDALQDTFWHVWRRAGQYDGGRAPPVVWLVLIARSRARDRRRRRHPEAGPPAGAAAVEDPSEAILEEESNCQVREALAKLPEEQRSAIVLAFYGGLTHQQVARRQGLPLGTVKTRIRLGMRRLRQFLGG